MIVFGSCQVNNSNFQIAGSGTIIFCDINFSTDKIRLAILPYITNNIRNTQLSFTHAKHYLVCKWIKVVLEWSQHFTICLYQSSLSIESVELDCKELQVDVIYSVCFGQCCKKPHVWISEWDWVFCPPSLSHFCSY